MLSELHPNSFVSNFWGAVHYGVRDFFILSLDESLILGFEGRFCRMKGMRTC